MEKVLEDIVKNSIHIQTCLVEEIINSNTTANNAFYSFSTFYNRYLKCLCVYLWSNRGLDESYY